MSTDNKTPPDPDGSKKPSAEKIKTAAKEAMKTAMEDGADLEEASTWLALNLANITIQLHPNSNQLDPEQLEDLATKALDTRGNEETSESLEKVLRTAKNKHVEVYTTMENVLRNVNENALPEEKSRSRATKAIRGDMPAELWDKYSNYRDSGTKFPIQIEDIKEWCIMNKTCFICF